MDLRRSNRNLRRQDDGSRSPSPDQPQQRGPGRPRGSGRGRGRGRGGHQTAVYSGPSRGRGRGRGRGQPRGGRSSRSRDQREVSHSPQRLESIHRDMDTDDEAASDATPINLSRQQRSETVSRNPINNPVGRNASFFAPGVQGQAEPSPHFVANVIQILNHMQGGPSQKPTPPTPRASGQARVGHRDFPSSSGSTSGSRSHLTTSRSRHGGNSGDHRFFRNVPDSSDSDERQQRHSHNDFHRGQDSGDGHGRHRTSNGFRDRRRQQVSDVLGRCHCRVCAGRHDPTKDIKEFAAKADDDFDLWG